MDNVRRKQADWFEGTQQTAAEDTDERKGKKGCETRRKKRRMGDKPKTKVISTKEKEGFDHGSAALVKKNETSVRALCDTKFN